MGKQTRSRWAANVRSLEIVGKKPEDVTPDELAFLKENFTSTGGLIPKGFHGGAFFTPTHLARFIVQALNIPKGAKVLEPSCGSGVFIEHLEGCQVTGIELDETSAKVSNLLYPNAEIINDNAFHHKKRNYYDYAIGNPPFGETVTVEGKTDFETLKYTKKTNKSKGKSENAFIELAIKTIKPGGYVALILPMGLGYSGQAKTVRKLIYDTCWTIANIKLPPETFQHVGTSVPTQILILRKVTPNVKRIKSHKIDATFFDGQQPVFMAKVQDIGWDRHGKSTDKWGDGLTQLDLLLEAFTDDYLMRENLYPYEPSWVELDKDETFAPFQKDGCGGEKYAKSGYRKEIRDKELLMWNEMTLGMGEGTSWDFYRQDGLVNDYYYLTLNKRGDVAI